MGVNEKKKHEKQNKKELALLSRVRCQDNNVREYNICVPFFLFSFFLPSIIYSGKHTHTHTEVLYIYIYVCVYTE